MEAVLGIFIFVVIVIICCRDELRDKGVLRQDTPVDNAITRLKRSYEGDEYKTTFNVWSPPNPYNPKTEPDKHKRYKELAKNQKERVSGGKDAYLDDYSKDSKWMIAHQKALMSLVETSLYEEVKEKGER